MAKKRIVIPITGQNFSLPSTELNDTDSFGENVRVFQGVITQKSGNDTYGTGSMSGAILHLGRYQKNNGTLNMLRFSSTKTQNYNSSTGVWDDITKSSTDWTGTEGTDFFDTAIFSNEILITNGIDNIQKYTGSGLCTNLSGSAPFAKYIEAFGSYLVLANIVDGVTPYPYRVQWCDNGDATNFTSGNAGSLDLADDASPIVGMKKLNEFLVVYKESSIYVGRLTESVSVFNFTLQHTGIGLLNNRCIIDHNGLHYFLARDGNIYAFNGIRVEPVASKIKDDIFARWNSDRFLVNHAQKNIYDRTLKFYIATGSSSWPNEVWSISYDNGAIFKETCSGFTSSETFKDTSTQESWDSDSESWDSDRTRWDEGIGGTGFEFNIFGKSDGTVVKESVSYANDIDDIIIQDFITKDFHFDAQENYKRWLSLEFWAKGSTVHIAYSTDFGVTWTDVHDQSNEDFTLSDDYSNYIAYFDVTSAYIRFRFRNHDLDNYYTLRQYSLEGIVKGPLKR